jgi:hypothetical protein
MLRPFHVAQVIEHQTTCSRELALVANYDFQLAPRPIVAEADRARQRGLGGGGCAGLIGIDGVSGIGSLVRCVGWAKRSVSTSTSGVFGVGTAHMRLCPPYNASLRSQ